MYMFLCAIQYCKSYIGKSELDQYEEELNKLIKEYQEIVNDAIDNSKNKKVGDLDGLRRKFKDNAVKIEDGIKGLGTYLIQIMIQEMGEDAYVFKLCTFEENEQFK